MRLFKLPSLLSITGSIFYIGYLVFQFPFGYLLQRLPTGRLLSITVICWGAILLSSPACTSFAGMATNRFLLGAFESATNPGFVLLMSMWYTVGDQPLRLEAYYSTIGIATMFSGLIGYAIGHIHAGLAKWMYIYIIFGSITMAWGIASLFLLPDSPSTARFFTPREAAVAVERVAANKQGIKNHVFKTYQAVQAAKDPKTWILFLMAVAGQIPTAAVTSKIRISCVTVHATNLLPLHTPFTFFCIPHPSKLILLKASLVSTSPASASTHLAVNTCSFQAEQYNSSACCWAAGSPPAGQEQDVS